MDIDKFDQPFFKVVPPNEIKKLLNSLNSMDAWKRLVEHISTTFNMIDIQRFSDAKNSAEALLTWWRVNRNPTVREVARALIDAELQLAADVVLALFGLSVDVKTKNLSLQQEASGNGDELVNSEHTVEVTNQLHTALAKRLAHSGEVVVLTYKQLCILTDNFTQPLLGRGGFGVVSKGHCGSLCVAVKSLTLADSSISNTQQLERYKLVQKQFDAEVKFLSIVKHSHIITLLAYCSESLTRCLIYEYMHYGTLENCLQHVANRTALSAAQRVRIISDIGSALAYLHTLCPIVVHRDVKSANILLDVHLTAKLADFGLAHQGPSGASETHVIATEKLGTNPYVPYEYWKRGEISVLLDAYSFGVVMWELLTGLPAYDDNRDEPRLADHTAGLCDVNDLGRLLAALDTRDGLWPQHIAVAMAMTALRLTSEKKANRASVTEVLAAMEVWCL